MRKILTFLVLIVLMVFMVGCYSYGDLVDIAFFNLDNEEIEGEFRDLDDIYDEHKNISISSPSFKKQPLNSPSPRNMYYYASVNEGDTILVRFKLKCDDSRFYSLKINGYTLFENDFEKIEEIDNYTYIYYKCTNINSTNNEYVINELNVKKSYNNYIEVANRDYGKHDRISGFYFNVN